MPCIMDSNNFLVCPIVFDLLVKTQIRYNGFKFLIFTVAWLLIQHSLSGIRHLLLDMGIGYGLPQARASAWTAFGISLLLACWVAVLLWK